MSWKTIVGLEIHLELSTETKMFCGCKNAFGMEVNSLCCPICMGLPGALPQMNKRAVEYAIMAGLALNCEIRSLSRADRKNYFYPDLAKGYQISQDELPLCYQGFISLDADEEDRKVRIRRIHIEEDTGKCTHTDSGDTLIDFNRSGVPLIEVVTEPDIHSSAEAYEFLNKLKNTLKYIGISDCKMEEGSLRCDININVVDSESDRKSNITEIKNLNSFRGAVKAIEFEQDRHRELLEKGLNTVKETRRWDDVNHVTISMREKLTADEYRYVPDADLMRLFISKEYIEEIRSKLPELPEAKRQRLISEYALSEYDAKVLTDHVQIADFFEAVCRQLPDSKLVANWIIGELLRYLKESEKEVEEILPASEDFVALLQFVKEGKINNNTAKKVLREMLETGEKAKKIIERDGLIQISDENVILDIVRDILAKNPQSIEDIKNGKDRAVGFLVGQVMKASKGKANPQMVHQMIQHEIYS